MRTSELPELFGIIRMSQFRNPCVQICSAEHITRGSHRSFEGLDYHIVENLNRHDESLPNCEFDMLHNVIDRHLLLIRYKHPMTGQFQEVYCWFLPFHVVRNGYSIPILDFAYRSWLPTNYNPVPIHYNIGRVIEIIEQFQQDKLREIQHIEDLEAEPYISWGNFLGRRRSIDPYETPNERYYNSRSTSRFHRRAPIRTPSPPPPQPVRIVEVQVPVERVVVQTRVQNLPKAVGDILLANARQSAETCPIAAVPFKECEKICVTSCFHIFDSESLTRWRTDHMSCPVCRTKIENVVSE
jgi:hypothetical protein